MTMPVPVPTAGTRTAWPGSATSTRTCAWASRCGTGRTTTSRSGCSACPGRRATTARTPRSTGGTSMPPRATGGCTGATTTRRPPTPTSACVDENSAAGKDVGEFELLDTGVFADDRFFAVEVQYAKAGPEDIVMRVTVTNHGPEHRPIHVLPTLWFRDVWTGGEVEGRPQLSLGAGHIVAEHSRLGRYRLHAQSGPGGRRRPRRSSATTRPTSRASGAPTRSRATPRTGSTTTWSPARQPSTRSTRDQGSVVVPRGRRPRGDRGVRAPPRGVARRRGRPGAGRFAWRSLRAGRPRPMPSTTPSPRPPAHRRRPASCARRSPG